MKDVMSVKEAARLWGVSETRIARLCREERIMGAVKEGRSWVLPIDAQYPQDNRITSGRYIRQTDKMKLPLPVGVSDYKKASEDYYYVDKTLLIKDFLDERPIVSLFTRPRRFGKTLNMDMLRVFFEKTEEDTSVYFRDKEIWACGSRYREHQGKYPVIFLTFKDIKKETWEETYQAITWTISQEYKRHTELAGSSRIQDCAYYDRISSGNADQADLEISLYMLSKMLHDYHGVAPIVMIDEYDTPIQQGHVYGFYEKVVLFMRNFFSGGLKDNPHLSYGFLTGILRVAKESIFSGLNNLKVNSILDDRYGRYFGFTPEEVKKMTVYYGVPEKYEEICAWYDGYRFGQTEIFNPWSVINYFSNNCVPQAFWISTSSNDILGEVITHADEDTYDKLCELLQDKPVLTYVDTNVIYPQITENPSSIYSFLLVTGYLKTVKTGRTEYGELMCEVALPNREVTFAYKKEILSRFHHIVPQSVSLSIQEAVYSGNTPKLRKLIETLLMRSVSCYDTAGETFYHGLVLGLCAMFDDRYYITSNRESGEGRYDIQLEPKDFREPGILIELKAQRNTENDELNKLAQSALQQIDDKKYDTSMKEKGVSRIFKYGVAFSGKQVQIVTG